jgi:hypothetical protein
MEHILTGYDHLLFVFALLLLVGGFKDLVKTVTAFTVAHSVTLAASALGYVHFDAPKIEILVALSIAIVAVELAYKKLGRFSIAQQWPWLIARLRSAAWQCIRERAGADRAADYRIPAAVPVQRRGAGPVAVRGLTWSPRLHCAACVDALPFWRDWLSRRPT